MCSYKAMAQVLLDDEQFWNQAVQKQVQALMSMERRISLRQAPMPIKEKEVPEKPEIPIPFPNLVRVPIFGIEENTKNFQFEWPQPGDIHPNMLTTERITQIKFLASDYDLRGVQVKLSNGFLSPIFDMIGNVMPDHGDRVPKILLTDVTNEDIRTAMEPTKSFEDKKLSLLSQ